MSESKKCDLLPATTVFYRQVPEPKLSSAPVVIKKEIVLDKINWNADKTQGVLVANITAKDWLDAIPANRDDLNRYLLTGNRWQMTNRSAFLFRAVIKDVQLDASIAQDIRACLHTVHPAHIAETLDTLILTAQSVSHDSRKLEEMVTALFGTLQARQEWRVTQEAALQSYLERDMKRMDESRKTRNWKAFDEATDDARSHAESLMKLPANARDLDLRKMDYRFCHKSFVSDNPLSKDNYLCSDHDLCCKMWHLKKGKMALVCTNSQKIWSNGASALTEKSDALFSSPVSCLFETLKLSDVSTEPSKDIVAEVFKEEDLACDRAEAQRFMSCELYVMFVIFLYDYLNSDQASQFPYVTIPLPPALEGKDGKGIRFPRSLAEYIAGCAAETLILYSLNKGYIRPPTAPLENVPLDYVAQPLADVNALRALSPTVHKHLEAQIFHMDQDTKKETARLHLDVLRHFICELACPHTRRRATEKDTEHVFNVGDGKHRSSSMSTVHHSILNLGTCEPLEDGTVPSMTDVLLFFHNPKENLSSKTLSFKLELILGPITNMLKEERLLLPVQQKPKQQPSALDIALRTPQAMAGSDRACADEKK